MQGCSKTTCLCLFAIQLSRVLILELSLVPFTNWFPQANMLPLLIFTPHLPIFASSAMPFSATPTLFIYLFSPITKPVLKVILVSFAENVSARCWVNRLTLCCCFCIDLYREVFLLFSLPCNINRVDEIIKPSICAVSRHYTVLSTNNHTVTRVGKYTFKQT